MMRRSREALGARRGSQPAAFLAAVSAVTLTLVAPSARSNGRFPNAQDVAFGNLAGKPTVVLRTTFGLVVSDGGGPFRLICEDPFGYQDTAFDPSVVVDAAGRLHVGLYDGAARVSTDRCDFPREATLGTEFVIDLDAAPGGKSIVAGTATGFSETVNHLYRSDDSGETFRPLAATPPGIRFETVAISPSDPSRVYATALRVAPRKLLAYRSDDGGRAVVELETFPYPDAIGAFVAAVDPIEPDRFYVRVQVRTTSDASLGRDTVLVVSDDRGATWRTLLRVPDDMTGFAVRDDGMTLWAGALDPSVGIQRSDDRGKSWRRVSDAHVRCLRWHAGQLYVCASAELDGFALAVSCDGAGSLDPLLRLQDIAGVFTCPATSPEATKCPARYLAARALFPDGGVPTGRDASCGDGSALETGPFDAAPVDAGGEASRGDEAGSSTPAPDASVASPSTPDGPATEPSCGCETPGGTRERDARNAACAWLALAACALVTTRRAWARGRARSPMHNGDRNDGRVVVEPRTR